MIHYKPCHSLFAAFFMIVFLVGCGTSSRTVGLTSSPIDVNRIVAGERAQILLTDGRVIMPVTDVRMTEDVTVFRERSGSLSTTVPTSDVHSIGVRVRTGRARGAAIGALPGLAYAGIGSVILLSNRNSATGILAGGTVAVTGLLGMGIGALAGMLIGDAVTSDVYEIVYLAPATTDTVERVEAEGAGGSE